MIWNIARIFVAISALAIWIYLWVWLNLERDWWFVPCFLAGIVLPISCAIGYIFTAEGPR